jgi:hypothetical protein
MSPCAVRSVVRATAAFVAVAAAGAAAAVWIGASPRNQPNASTHATPAIIPAPPTIITIG